MNRDLRNAIEQIRSIKDLVTWEEARLKNGVVQRVFSLLGWDVFNVFEVQPECSLGTLRVDYALRDEGVNKVFVEVKRPSESLEAHQEQLLTYAFREGVKLAVLTNGVLWWWYLPLGSGDWEQRRFFSLDIQGQDVDEVVERLAEFLSKDRVVSGAAGAAAEALHQSQQRSLTIKRTIPKAWQKLITGPDDLLVELLIETTERLCGFRPDMVQVEAFLAALVPQSPGPVKVERSSRRPERVSPPRSRERGDYIGTKLDEFVLFGESYRGRTWQDLLLTVAGEVYRRRPGEFEKCLSLRGSKWVYFSTDPAALNIPKQIGESPFYAETKLNSNSIVRRCRELLSILGYKEDDLSVRVSG